LTNGRGVKIVAVKPTNKSRVPNAFRITFHWTVGLGFSCCKKAKPKMFGGRRWANMILFLLSVWK
jgi:hypothetical protein